MTMNLVVEKNTEAWQLLPDGLRLRMLSACVVISKQYDLGLRKGIPISI